MAHSRACVNACVYVVLCERKCMGVYAMYVMYVVCVVYVYVYIRIDQ
jgi:hypothetical protein